MPLTFGDKIKTARKAKNLTQRQLAEKIGAKHNSISDWENDKNKPDPDTIEILCGVLEITPNYLLDTLSNSDDFSPFEKNIIKKYRTLDTDGQETVNCILDREYNIAKQVRAQSEALAAKDTRITELESTLDKRPSALHLYTYMNKIACAGIGFYFEDIPSDIIEAPYVEDADFIIGVSGDSMEPDYYDGDKLYVRKAAEIPTGKTGIFLNGNECFIKELGIDGLISHNKKYDDIPASEDIRVIGEVLGKVDESYKGGKNYEQP